MFTNADIKRSHEKLFAHTAALYAGGLLAGRERELGELYGALDTMPPGSFIFVSDLLGAGKTFLLSSVQDELRTRGVMDRDEATLIIVRKLEESHLAPGRASSVIIIDEVDQKEPRERLMPKLEMAKQAFEGGVTHIIVSGDYTLHDKEVLGTLADGRPHEYVQLDPLAPELFLNAMVLRAVHHLGAKDRDRAPTIRAIFEDDFLRHIIPNTDPPVATFRDVLSTLSKIADTSALPLDRSDCQLTGDVCRAWFDILPKPIYTSQQVEFLDWLRETILTADDDGTPINAFFVAHCRKACPIQGIVSDAEYEEQILAPLANNNLLRGFGIPRKDGIAEPRTVPEPYLPTPTSFLRAVYDEWWLG